MGTRVFTGEAAERDHGRTDLFCYRTHPLSPDRTGFIACMSLRTSCAKLDKQAKKDIKPCFLRARSV